MFCVYTSGSILKNTKDTSAVCKRELTMMSANSPSCPRAPDTGLAIKQFLQIWVWTATYWKTKYTATIIKFKTAVMPNHVKVNDHDNNVTSIFFFIFTSFETYFIITNT